MTAEVLKQNPLLFYAEEAEKKIQESFFELGGKSLLRDACEYALLQGKRFRPALVVMVGEAIGRGATVWPAAIAIEYFHTASLIADDLPCMDNDDERRSRPSLHKAFDESTALLASYALIAAGYGLLAKNAAALKESVGFDSELDGRLALAIECVSLNTGLNGACGGQFLDLSPTDLSVEGVKKILHQKTVTLFEIAFVLGWLFGGGAIERLDLVKKAARHFGLAFQIADDLGDQEQDKINCRQINVANLFGDETAYQMLNEEVLGYKETLKELKIDSEALLGLVNLL